MKKTGCLWMREGNERNGLSLVDSWQRKALDFEIRGSQRSMHAVIVTFCYRCVDFKFQMQTGWVDHGPPPQGRRHSPLHYFHQSVFLYILQRCFIHPSIHHGTLDMALVQGREALRHGMMRIQSPNKPHTMCLSHFLFWIYFYLFFNRPVSCCWIPSWFWIGDDFYQNMVLMISITCISISSSNMVVMVVVVWILSKYKPWDCCMPLDISRYTPCIMYLLWHTIIELSIIKTLSTLSYLHYMQVPVIVANLITIFFEILMGG